MDPERLDFLLRMLRIYIDLYVTDPIEKYEDKITDINLKVLNLKTTDGDFKALSFYVEYLTKPDSTLLKLKFNDCFLRLCERILNRQTVLNTNATDLIRLREYSLSMLRNKQFRPALKGLEVCLAADSISEYHVCYISIAYILNDQYDKAVRLFNKWKDVPLKGYESLKVYSYNDGFLFWINRFKESGFDHPDLERAKEFLKK